MGFFTVNVSKLEKENNVSELVKCLEHKNENVRYSAFVALAHARELDNAVLEKLKKMVHDPDPWVRTLAVLKFAELGDKTASDSLLEIMDEGSVKNKIELLKIIIERGATEDPGVLQSVVIALGDKKEVIRNDAVAAASATKSRHMMQYLADALHEKHHRIKMNAIKALYEIGGDESADYLLGFLADENNDVVAIARSYLSSINIDYVQKALHDAEFKQLISGLNGREPDREKTARMIGADKIREGLPLLHRASRDKYKGVRIECLKSMAQFRDDSSIEFAEKLLEDKYHEVRIEAINTLETIGGKRAFKAIEAALNDKNRDVRVTAGQALGVNKNN